MTIEERFEAAFERVRLTKSRQLSEKTGESEAECLSALDICKGYKELAFEYLKVRRLAICRCRLDGTKWEEQDYLEEAQNRLNRR